MTMPKSSKILIVDDDPDACTSLRRILRLDGYDVDIAHSVAEMLVPREWSEYFAILLDRKLPDGTAEKLLPDLTERAPQSAIIIITGYADMESSIAALRDGADDYIIKPINPVALRASLARIIRVRKSELRALQAERLAAIGQIVTSMAHESRNFLQRICSAVEFLQEIVSDNEEALEEVTRIQSAEQGLEHLLDELREFAAPLNLDRDRQSLQTVWRMAWTDVTATKNVSNACLDEEIGELDLDCHIDAFRIGQVFRNLFENSLAACGDCPSVYVHCENNDGTLNVSVRDNGSGLNAEQRSNVFQPFFTTKSKGTGLGMVIAKRIVEAHGGEIRVGDCSDGAEFIISLPLGRSSS
ncbi:MAG: signal transduction histidine kinase [Pirellulaceae bacterium]|jgi:signal transduction histidine kinase